MFAISEAMGPWGDWVMEESRKLCSCNPYAKSGTMDMDSGEQTLSCPRCGATKTICQGDEALAARNRETRESIRRDAESTGRACAVNLDALIVELMCD